MDHVHHVPLEPLRRVDRGQDQVVLVQQRRPGQVGGGGRRVQRELGEEPAARVVPAGEVRELFEVGGSRTRRVVLPGDHGLEIRAEMLQLRGGGHRPFVPAAVQRGPEVADPIAGALRDGDRLFEEAAQGRGRIVGSRETQVVHHGARRRRADPLGQLQDPEPRDLVQRVLEDPQQRERVLHVRSLEELQPAVLHERDVATEELDLQAIGMVRCAEEHGLFFQRHAALAVFEDRATDRFRLVGIVHACAQRRALAIRAIGPERLVVAFRCERDHRVRQPEDRRGRAVVPFELDDRGPGEPLRELQDVANGRRAEPVDRLGVVAHDRQVAVRSGGPHRHEDVGLDRVGVLVLVHEDVVEQLRELRSGHR